MDNVNIINYYLLRYTIRTLSLLANYNYTTCNKYIYQHMEYSKHLLQTKNRFDWKDL